MDQRTAEILRRFKESWETTEAHFNLLFEHEGWDHMAELREFISILKNAGFDKKFRIGSSIHRLIFSRSVNHGLRKDQKHILIEAYNTGKYVIHFYDFTSPGELMKTYDQFSTDHLINNLRLMSNLRKLENSLVD